MYVLRSIITGPRFLSDVHTISLLSFLMRWRQLYCNLVRFVLVFELFLFMLSDICDEKFFIAYLTSSGASGGFHLVRMYNEGM